MLSIGTQDTARTLVVVLRDTIPAETVRNSTTCPPLEEIANSQDKTVGKQEECFQKHYAVNSIEAFFSQSVDLTGIQK